MITPEVLKYAVVLSGLGQIGLILGSLAIPKVLKWKEELAKVNPLTRQMFWVYSAYIWGTNLSFGLLSAFAPHWLIEPSPLGVAVSFFIFLYWGARVVIQFTYFDRSSAPQGSLYTLAEVALVTLFVWLTVVYGYLAWLNGVQIFL